MNWVWCVCSVRRIYESLECSLECMHNAVHMVFMGCFDGIFMNKGWKDSKFREMISHVDKAYMELPILVLYQEMK